VSAMIWNYTVPVDNESHIILCHDTVLPVVEIAWEEKDGSAVRFWTMHVEGIGASFDETKNWEFQVFYTGESIPTPYEYVGTAPRTSLGLIWHLFRRLA
jgi:hypothetical protein